MGKLALQFVSWVVTWMKERYPPLPLPLAVCGRWESPSQLPEVMNTGKLSLVLSSCRSGVDPPPCWDNTVELTVVVAGVAAMVVVGPG